MAEQELQRVRTQIRQEEVRSQTNSLTSQMVFFLYITHCTSSPLPPNCVSLSDLTCIAISLRANILTAAFTSSEQQERVSSLEEKLHSLRSSLQELQLHGSQQKQTISELQLKNNQQNIEMESLKRRIDELNQVRKPPGVLNFAEEPESEAAALLQRCVLSRLLCVVAGAVLQRPGEGSRGEPSAGGAAGADWSSRRGEDGAGGAKGEDQRSGA